MAAGYQTNLTAVAALADKEVAGRPVTILADRLAHHSLLQGALLSGARLIRFYTMTAIIWNLFFKPAPRKAISALSSPKACSAWTAIWPTSPKSARWRNNMALCSMSTRRTPPAFLAHAALGFAKISADNTDVAMGTFGKALGGFGSYLACDQNIRQFLIQRCGGLVYSTGVPPSVLGAMDAALTLVPEMAAERAHLLGAGAEIAAKLDGPGLELRRERQPDRARTDRRRS